MKVLQKNKKSQNFSLDLIISITVFLAVIAILFFVFKQSINNPNKQITNDANTLYNELTKVSPTKNDFSILDSDGYTVNYERLIRLAINSIEDYNKTKENLGIKNDFCIILINRLNETIWPITFQKEYHIKLKNGTLLTIQNNSVMYGIGSPKVIINGTQRPCGYVYNVSKDGKLTQIYP